jgi:hypothetical protein
VIDVIVLAGMTEVVVGSTDVGVPVLVESVELGPVKGRALFSGTWATDFAVVVEFLYAVERTLTEGGACVTNGAVSETDAVVLRLVKVGVVDVVEIIVVVVETVHGDEVVVTLASVPAVMGTIEFGLKKLVSLARLWFSQRWYTSEPYIILFVRLISPERTCRAQDCEEKTSRNQTKPSHIVNFVQWFRNSSAGIPEKLQQDFDHLGYELYFQKLRWGELDYKFPQ